MAIIEQYNELIQNGLREGDFLFTGVQKKRDPINKSGLVIPYGTAVVWDADLGGFAPPKEAGQTFMGITYRADLHEDASRDFGNGIVLYGYPAERRPFNYAVVADLYVWCETAFNPTSTLFFRHTANGAGKEVVGRFRTDADTATCDEVPRVQIINSSATAGLAHISIWG